MKQEKLESIIDTAKKMFARYGFRKTTVNEVARMARVAKALSIIVSEAKRAFIWRSYAGKRMKL